MTTAQLLIICMTTLLIVLVVAGPRPVASACADVFAGLAAGQEVAVHVGDGQSVRGNVIGCEPGHLTLGGAVLLAGGSETKLGGTVRIPSGDVTLLQEL